ncbi:MAG TPA: sulfotransferase [Candidatus Binataceae bacterium]|nr:sulfotransferase [Candidatus Binataceae bacterium]
MSAARQLPDTIGVGPPRTATTWLDAVLRGHVGLPRGIKETDFFSFNYDLGIEWYRSHFRDCVPALPVVEFSPVYFEWPDVPERIATHIPQCQILVTLRDPVARMYSHYQLLRREGWTGAASFEQTLANHEGWADRAGNLLSNSRYAHHLSRWFERFGRERTLVMIHDDLEASPQEYLDRVCAFIGVQRIELAGSRFAHERLNRMMRAPRSPRLAKIARRLRVMLERHQMDRARAILTPVFDYCGGGGELFAPMLPATEAALRERLRPEIEALETLINRDLSSWKTPRMQRVAG